MKYATLDEMQGMEFGVTGDTQVIAGEMFELLVKGNTAGWALRYNDKEGNMLDWDRLPEHEATELGLWPLDRN